MDSGMQDEYGCILDDNGGVQGTWFHCPCRHLLPMPSWALSLQYGPMLCLHPDSPLHTSLRAATLCTARLLSHIVNQAASKKRRARKKQTNHTPSGIVACSLLEINALCTHSGHLVEQSLRVKTNKKNVQKRVNKLTHRIALCNTPKTPRVRHFRATSPSPWQTTTLRYCFFCA
jgi:hypothetical protein